MYIIYIYIYIYIYTILFQYINKILLKANFNSRHREKISMVVDFIPEAKSMRALQRKKSTKTNLSLKQNSVQKLLEVL